MVTCVPGKQRLHRFGEHMGAVVADEFERARVFAGEKLDLGVVVDRFGEIGDRAVQRHGDAALGERGRYAFGDLEAGDAGFEAALGAVGEGDGNHILSSMLTRRDQSA